MKLGRLVSGLALWLLAGAVSADPGEANRLFVEAVQMTEEAEGVFRSVQAAEAAGPITLEERLEKLQQIEALAKAVLLNLEMIVADHSDSELAVRLVIGETIGTMSLENARLVVDELSAGRERLEAAIVEQERQAASSDAQEIVGSIDDFTADPSQSPANAAWPPAADLDPSRIISAEEVADAAASAEQGPPMTGAERGTFHVAVQSCWVVDPGSAAGRVTVTVAFELSRDARVAWDVRLLTHNAESAEAAGSAFEAARRAILRRQGDGFPLPADKFEQWRLVEMTFNPEQMVVR